jgi:type IV secretory pathway protease TraF
MLGSSLFRTNSSNIDRYLHLPGNRKELVHVPPPSLIPSKHIEEGTVFNFCRGLQRITRIKPQFVHCYNSHIVFTGNYVNTIKRPYCGRRYTAVTSVTRMKFPRAQACMHEKVKTMVQKSIIHCLQFWGVNVCTLTDCQ